MKQSLVYSFRNVYRQKGIYKTIFLTFGFISCIFSLTDIRSLAKDPKKKDKLKNPETILTVPMSLNACLQVLDENYDVMKELFGEAEHINTMNSMSIIHARFQKHRELALSTASSTENSSWNFNPLASIVPQASRTSQEVEIEDISPMLTYFGDENCNDDLVYAIGFDKLRKRVTLAFRGSVTTTDFKKDAMMSLKKQPNPVAGIDYNQSKEIGIHKGFYEYLLSPRENGKNKYQEIMGHIETLFSDSDRQKNYKLYVTGHSLGGALATLFSLHAAASAVSPDSVIPSPVCCVSVASPRVGDRAFQSAFVKLEELGHLRHLRVANDRDPVTMMPAATAKKIWSRVSPLAYLAYKLTEHDDEKEHFHHTGIKLRLTNAKWELAFLGERMLSSEQEETVDVKDESTSNNADRGATNSTIKDTIIAKSTEIFNSSLKKKDADEDNESESSSNDADRSESKITIKDGIIARSSAIINSSLNKKDTKRDTFQESKIPDVTQHFGTAYVGNLASVENDLKGFSLNELYTEKVLEVFRSKNTEN